MWDWLPLVALFLSFFFVMLAPTFSRLASGKASDWCRQLEELDASSHWWGRWRKCWKQWRLLGWAQRTELEKREGDGRWWLKWRQLWAVRVDGEVLLYWCSPLYGGEGAHATLGRGRWHEGVVAACCMMVASIGYQVDKTVVIVACA
jgi:hypothetical protein